MCVMQRYQEFMEEEVIEEEFKESEHLYGELIDKRFG